MPRLAILLGTATVLVAILIARNSRDPATPASTDGGALARQMCREFIKRELHDPGSADWVEQWNWPTVDTGGSTWAVTATFRARNAFGGIRTSTTRCLLRVDGDSWSLTAPL